MTHRENWGDLMAIHERGLYMSGKYPSQVKASNQRVCEIYEASKREVPQQLKTQEVAAVTGLSIALLNNLRCSGGGPKFKKFGKCVRYDLNEVITWMERPSFNTVKESRSS
jgi:predicted DNA-binding transcriptional regulator AlpA